jgi:hypothetical protein
MRITVTRTGGFAGLHQQLGPVETSSLDSEVADQVSRIVTESDFFNLPQSLQGSPVYDGFRYTVRIDDGDREHTVEMEGLSEDPPMVRLHELIGVLDQAVGFDNAPTSSTLPDGVVRTHDWSAWYNRRPGADDPYLHVSGICGLASSSIMVRLEPGNVGVVPEPDLCVLQLAAVRPTVGDDRYVEREVTWREDVGPDLKRVRIAGVLDDIPVTIAE